MYAEGQDTNEYNDTCQEVTDLSDAPKEIKEQILQNDKLLKEREPKPYPARTRPRFINMHYETCIECGLDWNVSRGAVYHESGYLCPRCWGKQRTR